MKTEFEGRTRRFALAAMSFVSALPRAKSAEVIGYQFVRSATSIGANYREAQRGESRADFVHKIALAEKEASESCYWLELCVEGAVGDSTQAKSLLTEAEELLAILASMGKKAKRNTAVRR